MFGEFGQAAGSVLRREGGTTDYLCWVVIIRIFSADPFQKARETMCLQLRIQSAGVAGG